jgi:hypothetical protein
MEKFNAIDNLRAALDRAINEEDTCDILSVITGSFVGLTIELVRLQGHDQTKEIFLDGGQQRDITIHEEKKVNHSFNKIIH